MAAPTYFGSASNPSDNGSANEPSTLFITPPSSMQAGDLVVMVGQHMGPGGAAGGGMGLNATGGQTWSSSTAIAASSGMKIRMFWCQFNGTWSADPSVDFAAASGTQATTLVGHVFRPSSGSVTWELNVTNTPGAFAAPSSPFTVTLNSVTPTKADNVTIAIWASDDDNTWGSLSGTGWVVTGNTQYRNTAGSDMSLAFAHFLQSGTSATGAPSLNQATLGGDAGVAQMFAFAAVPAGTTTPLTLTETLTITDSLIRQAGKVLLETLTITDSLKREISAIKSETLTITDTVLKQTQKPFTETLTITDVLTTARIYLKELLETITMSDTLTRLIGWVRSETLAITDTLKRDTSKTLTDTATITDTVLRQTQKPLSESTTISDTLTRQATKTLPETTVISDTLNKNISTTKTETLVVTDTVTKQTTKPLTETVSVTDVLQTIRTFLKELTETITMTDTLSNTTSKLLTETLTFTDTVVRQTSKLLLETIVYSDTLNTILTHAPGGETIRRMLMRVGK